MPRLLIGIALICTLLFFLIIEMIRAPSYTPDDLQGVLLDMGDCQKPCWQQIRPGVTTVSEALSLLQKHGWIDEIMRNDELIEWTWSGQQSALIDGSQPGSLRIQGGVVVSVRMMMAVGVGDFALLLGYPYWHSTNRTSGHAEIGLNYPNEYLSLNIAITCPTTRAQFWLTHPQVELRSFPRSGVQFTTSLFGRSITC